MQFDVLIVGAGHAGVEAAAALRQNGFAGTVALVGAEAEPPYERPPLSKEYLKGERSTERLRLRPDAFWAQKAVTLITGRRIVAVDAPAHEVRDAAGAAIGYRHLIWATGGAARRLDCLGHDLAGVHTVRERVEVDAIAAELPGAQRIAVIGGGYVGLEAAAVLAERGKQVVVLEAQDRVLARVAGAALSRFYEGEHRAHGVEIRLGVGVAALEGTTRVEAVRLADGTRIAADMAIVGIGIVPAVQPLAAAGARCGDGVEVDAACRTSLPDIFAIGDAARQVRGNGQAMRIESVQNAHEQAAIAARAIVGADPPARAVPWFWSNQYDLKLQTVGLSAGHDAAVLRGDPADRSFSVVYLAGGRVIALDCVNRVRDYVQGRALVAAGAVVAPERLADAAVPLKDMAAA